MYYNHVRRHGSLGMRPGEAAGIRIEGCGKGMIFVGGSPYPDAAEQSWNLSGSDPLASRHCKSMQIAVTNFGTAHFTPGVMEHPPRNRTWAYPEPQLCRI